MKLLIFTTGRKTWLPHQVGIKLMSKIPFSKQLVIPNDISKWYKQNHMEMAQERLNIETMPWHDFEVSEQGFHCRVMGDTLLRRSSIYV